MTAPDEGGGEGREAGAREELHLDRMTWPEVEESLRAGRRTVVIGVGATEQHGPHLPLCTDAVRGTALAEAVARRLGDALVAPAIPVGCSDHHMGFPGTLSLRRETLLAVCRDCCASLARHGFRTICLVPSHGGNFAPLRDGLSRLNEAVGDGCRVRAYTDLSGFLDVWRAVVEEVAGAGDRVGGHADVAESSEMLVLRPELVRVGRATAGYTGEITDDVLDRMFEGGIRALTANGILGDARGLDEEIGRRCLERAADVIAEALR